jgi:hypothetical protein
MAFEQKEGQGALFRNDKGDNPNRPDYKGEILIDGTLYEIAGWLKDGAKGKFLSLSAKPKEAKKPKPKNDLEDDIPW